MNDSIFELVLSNNKTSFKYLIDIFHANTIQSQDIVYELIDSYRKKFNKLDKEYYSLSFRITEESEDIDVTEKVIKIKNNETFVCDINTKIDFESIEKRSNKILDNINFKL